HTSYVLAQAKGVSTTRPIRSVMVAMVPRIKCPHGCKNHASPQSINVATRRGRNVSPNDKSVHVSDIVPPRSDGSKPPNSADNLTVGTSARMARGRGLVRAALSQLGYPPVRPSWHGLASACGRAGGAYPYHRKYPYGEKR